MPERKASVRPGSNTGTNSNKLWYKTVETLARGELRREIKMVMAVTNQSYEDATPVLLSLYNHFHWALRIHARGTRLRRHMRHLRDVYPNSEIKAMENLATGASDDANCADDGEDEVDDSLATGLRPPNVIGGESIADSMTTHQNQQDRGDAAPFIRYLLGLCTLTKAGDWDEVLTLLFDVYCGGGLSGNTDACVIRGKAGRETLAYILEHHVNYTEEEIQPPMFQATGSPKNNKNWRVRCYQWLKKAYKISGGENEDGPGLNYNAVSELLKKHEYICTHMRIGLAVLARDMWEGDLMADKLLKELRLSTEFGRKT